MIWQDVPEGQMFLMNRFQRGEDVLDTNRAGLYLKARGTTRNLGDGVPFLVFIKHEGDGVPGGTPGYASMFFNPDDTVLGYTPVSLERG